MRAGGRRRRGCAPAIAAYRSENTSVSTFPFPLRRIVPVAPSYAPVPPVIA